MIIFIVLILVNIMLRILTIKNGCVSSSERLQGACKSNWLDGADVGILLMGFYCIKRLIASMALDVFKIINVSKLFCMCLFFIVLTNMPSLIYFSKI